MSPLLKRKNTQTDSSLLRRYCITSGALALFIMLFVYLCHQNTLLGGDNTVLRMDLYHQYGPLYAELYDRITNGYSLVYSWTSGLGGSFLGNMFNYCCSPFALILLFTGHENMPEAIALMILLKAVLSSVTFTYYINKTNRTVNRFSVIFGLLYAFTGFFVAYSWNIMWLDAMTVFPLVILGIERIIQYKKPSLFIFALTYTMITNYYMAYMVCILCVLYFIYYYFGRYELASVLVTKKKCEETKTDEVITVAESEPDTSEFAQTAADVESGITENVADIVDDNVQTDENTVITSACENASEEVTVSADDLSSQEPVCAEQTAEPVIAEITDATEKKSKKTKKEKRSVRNSRFWITGFTFAFSAILCFLLSAFALIPVYYCLQSSSATSASFPDTLKVYFNIFDFIANHLAGLEPTIRSSGSVVLPNVYCGIMTVMLIPLYFLSKNVPGKQKIMAVCLLGIFYISFAMNYLNFIWHGFHFPNDLPYRYSFAYSFILLTLAYKAILNIKEFSNKVFITVGIAMLGFIILVQELGSLNVGRFSIIISIIFTVAYVIVFGMMNSPKYLRKSIVTLLIAVIVCELCLANTPNYVMQQSKTNYTSDYQSYQELSKNTESSDEELFYRTELSKLRTRMDACWYGYNGVSTFSSMAYEHTANLMRSLGMFGNKINSYTYYPQTAIFNSMFALRYIYDNEKLINNDDFYTEVAANDNFTSYNYKYYLPIAFSVDAAVEDWDLSSTNPFTVQNKFIESAAGISDVLIPVQATDISTSNLNSVSLESVNNGTAFNVTKSNKGSEATATVYVDITEEADYYVYFGSTKLSSVNITADNFTYTYVSSSIQPFTIDVGKQPVGARIAVKYTVAEDSDTASVTFCAAKLDNDKFIQAYDKFKTNGTINLTSFDETSMSGTVNVTNDNALLYTSIPYDESWEITVDGKVIEYYHEPEEGADTTSEETSDGKAIAVGNALIGVNIEKGEHTVSFNYRAKGLSTGFKLTCVGLLILIMMLLFKFCFKKRLEAKGKRTSLFPAPDNYNY